MLLTSEGFLITQEEIMSTDIDKIVEHIKQFVEASTPVAKQAYEVGLVTLQIDAAQSLLWGFAFSAAGVFLLIKTKGIKDGEEKGYFDDNEANFLKRIFG